MTFLIWFLWFINIIKVFMTSRYRSLKFLLLGRALGSFWLAKQTCLLSKMWATFIPWFCWLGDWILLLELKAIFLPRNTPLIKLFSLGNKVKLGLIKKNCGLALGKMKKIRICLVLIHLVAVLILLHQYSIVFDSALDRLIKLSYFILQLWGYKIIQQLNQNVLTCFFQHYAEKMVH